MILDGVVKDNECCFWLCLEQAVRVIGSSFPDECEPPKRIEFVYKENIWIGEYELWLTKLTQFSQDEDEVWRE